MEYCITWLACKLLLLLLLAHAHSQLGAPKLLLSLHCSASQFLIRFVLDLFMFLLDPLHPKQWLEALLVSSLLSRSCSMLDSLFLDLLWLHSGATLSTGCPFSDGDSKVL